jgi:hypothetical protein
MELRHFTRSLCARHIVAVFRSSVVGRAGKDNLLRGYVLEVGALWSASFRYLRALGGVSARKMSKDVSGDLCALIQANLRIVAQVLMHLPRGPCRILPQAGCRGLWEGSVLRLHSCLVQCCLWELLCSISGCSESLLSTRSCREVEEGPLVTTLANRPVVRRRCPCDQAHVMLRSAVGKCHGLISFRHTNASQAEARARQGLMLLS